MMLKLTQSGKKHIPNKPINMQAWGAIYLMLRRHVVCTEEQLLAVVPADNQTYVRYAVRQGWLEEHVAVQ